MRLVKGVVITLGLIGLLYGLNLALTYFVVDYYVRILILCGLNAILAIGLNLINGTTGQFSIGHAGFMAVGAYTAAFTVVKVEALFGTTLQHWPPLLAAGVCLTPGLIVGGLAAGLTGVVVGVPSLRLKGDYLAIVTLGFAEIIRLLFNNSTMFGGATGFSGGRPLGLTPYTNFFWVALWVIVCAYLIWNLTYSSSGRALRAIREDEIAAEAMGINTTRMKVMAFVVSAVAAGIAGGLFAHLQSSVSPNDFKMSRSVDVIVMIIVGGLGSLSGAIVGGVAVGLALELLRGFEKFRLIVYPLILITLMLVRPDGIFGRHELSLNRVKRLFRRRSRAGS